MHPHPLSTQHLPRRVLGLLGIKRNAVVLPPGYEVVACNYPSQVVSEPGAGGPRLRMSFMNLGPDAVSYVVKGRRTK